jgi:hypothetical protein
MRVYENGIYRDLTAEEIAEYHAEAEKLAAEMGSQLPTIEERLAAMEAALIALMEG